MLIQRSVAEHPSKVLGGFVGSSLPGTGVAENAQAKLRAVSYVVGEGAEVVQRNRPSKVLGSFVCPNKVRPHHAMQRLSKVLGGFVGCGTGHRRCECF